MIDLMDKEEVLEVEDQIQKALKKESKDAKDEKESETAATKPPVPATPVTKEAKLGREEFDEDIIEAKRNATSASSSKLESRETPTPRVEKDSADTDTVQSPPLAPGVPRPPKKAEGSKQL